MRDRKKHNVYVSEYGSVYVDNEHVSTSETVPLYLGFDTYNQIALREFKGATPMKFRYEKRKRFSLGFVSGRGERTVWLCHNEMQRLFKIGPRSTRFTIWVKPSSVKA